MRIAIFTETFYRGGIDTFISNLISGWPRPDDRFVIIANADYPGLEYIEAQARRRPEVIRHRVAVYGRWLTASEPRRLAMRLLSPVLRYVTMASNILALQPVLARANCDVLMVVNGGYPGGDSCRAASIAWGLMGRGRSVQNFHNLVQQPRWYVRLQEAIVDFLVCRFTSCFVTVSRAAAQTMAARPVVTTRAVIRYIHNGISPKPLVSDRCETRRAAGIPRSAPLCLMLATYEPRKGHRFLLQAFAEVLKSVPDAQLLMCGHGMADELATMVHHVQALGLERSVHVMDYRADSSDLIAAADVVVVASQTYESFGLTLVEAMAQRVPVVATDVGGIPEVVQDGDGGYCVERHDVTGFARRLAALLQDAGLRRAQGERGYQRYQRMFTREHMTAEYARVVAALSAEGGR